MVDRNNILQYYIKSLMFSGFLIMETKASRSCEILNIVCDRRHLQADWFVLSLSI